MSEDQACEVPLVEQLRSIPEGYRTVRAIQWSDDGRETGHQYIPVGVMMHRAAAEIERLQSARPEAARIDAALRACDGLATADLAGNKRGWLAELCYDAHKLDEPHKAGAEKCLKIVQDMRSALVDEDGVDYGILSRVEYRLQKVVETPVAPLPSIPSPLAPKTSEGTHRWLDKQNYDPDEQ